MANEKRLMYADDFLDLFYVASAGQDKAFIKAVEMVVEDTPTVDAVEVEKYNELVDSYNDLREGFIDYICSGIPNLAPYCVNICRECLDKRGWCKNDPDSCRGFNPAKVIERRTDERKTD